MKWLLRFLSREDLVAELRRRGLAVAVYSKEDVERFYRTRNQAHPQRFKYGIDGGGPVVVQPYAWPAEHAGIEAAMQQGAQIAMAYSQDNDLLGVQWP